MAYCLRCGRLIHWVHTVTGALLPIDPEPMNGGTLMRLSTGKFRPLADAESAPGPLYKVHTDSCANKEPPPR